MPDVKNFKAFGIGAYLYFRDHSPVTVKLSFVVPEAPGVYLVNAFSFFLYCGPDLSKCGDSISNVINDVGGVTSATVQEANMFCSYSNGKYVLGSD